MGKIIQILFAIILCFLISGCISENNNKESEASGRVDLNKKILQESNINIEDVEVEIPGVSEEMLFLYISDLHIAVNDGYVDVENEGIINDRIASFSNSQGVTSADYWSEIVDTINKCDVDGTLMGADMLDFDSPSTIDVLKLGLEELVSPFMYIRADHDYNPYWCASIDKKKIKKQNKAIDDIKDGVQLWEYEEFCILGWDNSTSDISKKSLRRIKEVVSKNKPIILLTHVPIKPLEDKSLSDESKQIWQDKELLWGIEDTYYTPDDNTKELLNMIYSDNSSFIEVLCGHLHFTWDGYIREGLHQHVFSPAFSQNVGIIRIKSAP